MVVDSNVVGTTGPIPGSMGFVSNFNGHNTYIDFQRVVWYRYGKKGKPRIETGRFYAITDKSIDFGDFGKRRIGKVKLVGAKSWENMKTLEFLCWAFSILRLPKSMEQDKKLRDDLKQQFGVLYTTKQFRPEHLIHGGVDFGKTANRYMMFKFCRKWREAYYKCKIRQMQQSMDMLQKHIQADVFRAKTKQKVEHDPVSFAQALVQQKLPGPDYRYKAFVGSFIHDAILGPRAVTICKDNAWVSEIVKELCKKEGEIQL